MKHIGLLLTLVCVLCFSMVSSAADLKDLGLGETDNEKIVDDEETPADDLKELNPADSEILNSMLKQDFPKKTDFIAKEDEKVDGELLTKPSEVTSSLITAKPSEPLDLTDMFTKMGLSVLLLGVLVFALASLWKFLTNKSGKIFKPAQGSLNIVAQQMIAPKSRILIVEALGRKFLVGATETQIQLLSDMDFYPSETAAAENPSPAKQPARQQAQPAQSKDEFQNFLASQFEPVKTSDQSRQDTSYLPPHDIDPETERQLREARTAMKHSASERLKNKLRELKKI